MTTAVQHAPIVETRGGAAERCVTDAMFRTPAIRLAADERRAWRGVEYQGRP